MHILHRDTYGTIGIRGDTRVNNPLLGLGVASGLASGILGLFGQKDTNKTNLQATRETNAQNYKIWQEQQAHNKEMFALENQANIDMFNMQNQAAIDMWNMQNEYNDPSAQVERLLNAGLNPALMMGSNPSGVASSAPAVGNLSAGSAQPAQAPVMQQPNPITSPVQAAFANAMQGLMTTVASFSTAMKTPAEISNITAGTNNLMAQTSKTNFETNLAKKFEKWDLQLKENQAVMSNIDRSWHNQVYADAHHLSVANKAYLELQSDYQSMLNSWLPAEKQMQMMTNGAVLSNMWLDGELKELEIDNYFTRYLAVNVAQADLLQSEKEGQDIQNKVDDANFKASGLSDTHVVETVGKHMAEAVKFQAMLSRYTNAIDAQVSSHVAESRYKKANKKAWRRFDMDNYRSRADSKRAKSWSVQLPLNFGGYTQTNRD